MPRNTDTSMARKRSKEMRIERINLYNKNPKLCENCKTPISYDKRINKYCSHHCAATVTNKNRGERKVCLYCGKEIPYGIKNRDLKFCNDNGGRCHRFYNFETRINNGCHIDPKTVRSYYIELRGHRCEQCKLTEWMGQLIFLSIHHKNGDFEDHTPENVELLCGNCHPLTDNFGVKNKGMGRTMNPHKKKKFVNGKK